MRITIYNEPCRGAVGGSEISAAVLAEALSQDHEVELLHYRPSLTRELLANFADVDLTCVEVRFGPSQRSYKGAPWKVLERLRAERKQEASLSENCIVFIAFVHEPPPFCAAPTGILWVLFPFHEVAANSRLKRIWYRWKVGARLRTYQTKLSISEFSARWAKIRWRIDCGTLFPPVKVDVKSEQEKRDSILSVGRFAVDGHGKKQMEMLAAYARIRQRHLGNWIYTCVGGMGGSAAEVEFVRTVRARAAECGARIVTDASRAELEQLYSSSRIFWHAAGYDVDESREPERAEHFGISTVEAMAAGCVPVVANKGGQREIVEHGVSGFLWNSFDELEEYSIRLMTDASLWARMSLAARERSTKFSREEFVAKFRQVIAEYSAKTDPARSPSSHRLQQLNPSATVE